MQEPFATLKRLALLVGVTASVYGALTLAQLVLAIAQPTTTNTIFHDFTGGLRTTTLTAGALTATSFIATMPATQVIAAGNTIAADACGGVKRISAAGAVTTSTTATFTVTTTALAGCQMMVCNVGAQTITLDKNAATLLVGGVDVPLLANSCVGIVNDGTLYRQSTAQLTAT